MQKNDGYHSCNIIGVLGKGNIVIQSWTITVHGKFDITIAYNGKDIGLWI